MQDTFYEFIYFYFHGTNLRGIILADQTTCILDSATVSSV